MPLKNPRAWQSEARQCWHVPDILRSHIFLLSARLSWWLHCSVEMLRVFGPWCRKSVNTSFQVGVFWTWAWLMVLSVSSAAWSSYQISLLHRWKCYLPIHPISVQPLLCVLLTNGHSMSWHSFLCQDFGHMIWGYLPSCSLLLTVAGWAQDSDIKAHLCMVVLCPCGLWWLSCHWVSLGWLDRPFRM